MLVTRGARYDELALQAAATTVLQGAHQPHALRHGVEAQVNGLAADREGRALGGQVLGIQSGQDEGELESLGVDPRRGLRGFGGEHLPAHMPVTLPGLRAEPHQLEKGRHPQLVPRVDQAQTAPGLPAREVGGEVGLRHEHELSRRGAGLHGPAREGPVPVVLQEQPVGIDREGIRGALQDQAQGQAHSIRARVECVAHFLRAVPRTDELQHVPARSDQLGQEHPGRDQHHHRRRGEPAPHGGAQGLLEGLVGFLGVAVAPGGVLLQAALHPLP